jgi:poly(A) polymerase
MGHRFGWTGLIATETALDWDVDPMLRLMAIVPPDGERMKALAAQLKMSRAETARLSCMGGRA